MHFIKSFYGRMVFLDVTIGNLNTYSDIYHILNRSPFCHKIKCSLLPLSIASLLERVCEVCCKLSVRVKNQLSNRKIHFIQIVKFLTKNNNKKMTIFNLLQLSSKIISSSFLLNLRQFVNATQGLRNQWCVCLVTSG